jgi:heme/copper-type cytochrome/quinol oxidase subunit 2
MRSALVLAAAAFAVAAAFAAPARAAGHSTQTVVLTIRPVPASALEHVKWQNVKERLAPDERVAGSNFAVEPGVPVRVVVWNYTNMLHSFTSPELGVNVAILPGSLAHPHRAVFTFVAHTYGRIRWYCAVPCGGYMGGNVYAIIR